jgi:OTT_1508-like deaminase
MLDHYEHRLVTYTQNLRTGLHNLDASYSWNSTSDNDTEEHLLDCLQHIQELATRCLNSGNSASSRFEELVMAAIQVRRSENIKNSVQNGSSELRKVWKPIRFLARIRINYDHLTLAARQLPCFRKLFIECLKPSPVHERPEKPLALDEIFDRLDGGKAVGQARKAELVRTFCAPKPKWNAKLSKHSPPNPQSLEQDFLSLQISSYHCHAEIQIILHLAVEDLIDDVFSYIGCSKYSCVLCWEFLAGFGRLRTRGCHDTLYHLWTVPETGGLPAKQNRRIVKALCHVQDELKHKLLEVSGGRRDAKPESSARKTIYTVDAAAHYRSDDPRIER